MNDIDQIGIYINAFRDRHFTITDKNKPPCEVHLPEPFRHPDELEFNYHVISVFENIVAMRFMKDWLSTCIRLEIDKAKI